MNVGKDLHASDLLKKYDRVILCTGASNPRDIKAPGRDAKGVYFAVDFLKEVSKKLMDEDYDSDKLINSKDFSFTSSIILSTKVSSPRLTVTCNGCLPPALLI